MIQDIKFKLQNSKLFKDSFWAVFGNGIGNALMLLAGILIARFLGKDLYGEYGVVKTTMFYISFFATFGLGITSTKFIAQQIEKGGTNIRSVIRDSLRISLFFSIFLAIILVLFANKLALFLGNAHLSFAFKVLGCIIIFRAQTVTLSGCLSGLKLFKECARNSILAGAFLLLICIPLTINFSLKGALFSLFLSQVFNFIINFITLRKEYAKFPKSAMPYTSKLLFFSTPVALQESSIWICNWICILLLTKFSSSGELGLYSAATQWNAIISTIPSLLSSVVLSYASSVNDRKQHSLFVKRMFMVNFSGTIVPFLIVFFFASFISSFYGSTFSQLPSVLRILCFNAVIESCAYVFKAEFIANNKAWLFFGLRISRDLLMAVTLFIFLKQCNGINGAIVFSKVIVVTSLLYLLLVVFFYKTRIVRADSDEKKHI